MPQINTDRVKNVTLYTGNKGKESCICKCPCCSISAREGHYQGMDYQIDELLEELPALQHLYILGNPDPAVDTDFCNLVAKKATAKGIHVCFSTSGAGGKKVMKKLLRGISPDMVDYISFSIDSTNQERLCMLKGIYFPWDLAVDGIRWSIRHGYTVKVQPTLWSSNFKDCGMIINFFAPLGVKWFTFHIGSLESGVKLLTHRHLHENEIKLVHRQIDDATKVHTGIKVQCPVIFPSCGDDDRTKYYCMHIKRSEELLATFTSNGIQCTNTPIASMYSDRFTFKLGESADLPEFWEENFCPFGGTLVGDEKSKTLCRYVNKVWNY